MKCTTPRRRRKAEASKNLKTGSAPIVEHLRRLVSADVLNGSNGRSKQLADDLLDVPIHPAASLFPPLDDLEFAELVRDIETHGLNEPVVFYRGQLLDGRNRWQACKLLGVPVSKRELGDSDDPVAYVLSTNLHRRHLTTAQLAIAAARLKVLERQRAKERQKLGKENLPDPAAAGQARDKAGATMRVSGRTVDQAAKIISTGIPELIELVEQGEVSISTAAEVAEADKHSQERAVHIGKHAVNQLAQRRRQRKRRAKQRTENGQPPACISARSECIEEWEAVRAADKAFDDVHRMCSQWYWRVVELIGDPEVTAEQIAQVQREADFWKRMATEVEVKWKAVTSTEGAA